MAVTGRTADGAYVFNDILDSRGRFVIDPVARILDDGTHYFLDIVDLTIASFMYRDTRRR